MEQKTIGSFIAALRRASGMTQQELADRLDVSNKAVSRWERNESSPDLILIPSIAEIFGVTCDELIRGQRLSQDKLAKDGAGERQRTDRQTALLVKGRISKFKTTAMVAILLSFVGYAFMLGISYGFYRPIIGFAVMISFVLTSLSLTFIQINKMRDYKADSELFCSLDIKLISRFNKALGSFSLASLYLAVAVIMVSLPLLYGDTVYFYSVLYFPEYCGILLVEILALAAVFVMLKDRMFSLITGEKSSKTENKRSRCAVIMNRIQLIIMLIVLVAYAVFNFCFSENKIYATPEDVNSAMDIYETVVSYAVSIVIIFTVASFAIGVILSKKGKDRVQTVMIGIRNLIIIVMLAGVAFSNCVGYPYYGDGEVTNVQISEDAQNCDVISEYFEEEPPVLGYKMELRYSEQLLPCEAIIVAAYIVEYFLEKRFIRANNCDLSENCP